MGNVRAIKLKSTRVVAGVNSACRCRAYPFDDAVRHRFPDHIGQLADLIILRAIVLADIEGAVMNEITGSVQHGSKRTADVLDMHNVGPPGSAVAHDFDLAAGESLSATRLFKTMSARNRGETPLAVALRK